MISCTEFIPFYSELFKFLDKKGGAEKVNEYWEYISDKYVSPSLGEEVKKNGIEGCWNYWSKSLNEEACDFTMSLDKEKGEFFIDMHSCPSKGMLNNLKYTNPYPNYCGHCAVLYPHVLNKFGLYFEEDFSNVDKASCKIKISDVRIAFSDKSKRDKVKKYLSELDIDNLPIGRYALKDGDYLNIIETETKFAEQPLFEVHKKYIDAFYIISGSEKVLLTKKAGTEIKSYSENEDIALYNCKNYTEIDLRKGEILLINNNIYHSPSNAVDNAQKIKKAVFKLKI